MNVSSIKLVECPRDAMQGWGNFIPTDTKVSYLNQLLQVGFDVLDFGSFVSHKAIPQLADTKEVVKRLDLDNTTTRLLAIIANAKGAEDAVMYDEISYLGFPFSISETFQLRNTNKTIEQSLRQVSEIQNMCLRHGKGLVIYISMGFGNPYGDVFNPETVIEWVETLSTLGIQTFQLADTIGVATPEVISRLFGQLLPAFPQLEIGAHFHSTSQSVDEKIQAAYHSGCYSFDASINGIGGCPMAADHLVGNLPTERIVSWCKNNDVKLSIDQLAFEEALAMSQEVFV